MNGKMNILLTGLLGLTLVVSLQARCVNNKKGLTHVKAREGKGKEYKCYQKTREFYKGMADKLYDGTKCRICGCDSEEHKDLPKGVVGENESVKPSK